MPCPELDQVLCLLCGCNLKLHSFAASWFGWCHPHTVSILLNLRSRSVDIDGLYIEFDIL